MNQSSDNQQQEKEENSKQQGIEQQNPFTRPNTTSIDNQLETLKKEEEEEKKKGIVSQEKIREILKRVDQSLGMDCYEKKI